MRDILFRGKTVVDKKFVYGYVFRTRKSSFIIDKHWEEIDYYKAPIRHVADMIEVLDKTVGQFTGLLDKNGNNIFEGDILIDELEYNENEKVFHVARIGETGANRYGCFLDFCGNGKNWVPFISYFNRMEIIGNIHENPELLDL
jgi:uncharacterized phage protein (TIGR01671 family)